MVTQTDGKTAEEGLAVSVSEDNKGRAMLKLMGWSGGGLGR